MSMPFGALVLLAAMQALPALAEPAQPAPRTLTLPDAVRLALQKNPAIQLQQSQVRASAGAALQARGPFDAVLSSGIGAQRDQRPLRADEQARFPVLDGQQQIQSGNLRLGVDKLLESGVQVGSAYTYNAAADGVQGAQGIPLQASDRLTFTLKLPLQRNAGREAAAGLAAAEAEARAVQMEAEHAVAATVLSVAQAYWDWAARLATLEAARQSEARVTRLLQETEKLIALDELPPAESNLVRASLMERGAARVAAQQRSVEARNALGRLLGLDNAQASQLAQPASPLPDQPVAMPSVADLRAQVTLARRDLAAARTREDASQARVDAAVSALRPQTDLLLSGYYAGLREGGALAGNLPLVAQTAQTVGPGVAASLVFQFPLQQSAASGALATAYANLDAARLRRSALEDSIQISLDQAVAALQAVATQLTLSRDLVARYSVSVRNEETKRLLGNATLIDVLNVEDRLNNAQIARLQYQQSYATAWVQLLYEAGRLVRADVDGANGMNGGHTLDFTALLPVNVPTMEPAR